MVHGVAYEGQRVVLQEFRCFRKVRATGVEKVLECSELSLQVPIYLGRRTLNHETWVDCKVNAQIEFKFLANYVFVSQVQGHAPAPKQEKLFSLARVKSLSHILNGLLLVLDPQIIRFFESVGITGLLLHHFHCLEKPITD